MKGKLILSVEEAEKDYDKWLKVRNEGIGGSDIASIMGYSTFKDSYTLCLEKKDPTLVKDISNKPIIELGHVLEPYVAHKFTKATGIKLRKCGTLADEEYSFLHANVDRLCVGIPAGVEIKTTSDFNKKQWEDDNLPDAYYLQIQFYLMVTNLEKWYVAYLFRHSGEFAYKEVARNEEIIADIRKAAVDFWLNYVKGDLMPAPGGNQTTTDYINEKFSNSNGLEIDLPSSAAELIKQHDYWKEQEDFAKNNKDAADNAIKLLMGDNEIGYFGKRKISWKSSAGRVTVDTKKLQKEYPDAYAACSKQSKSSRPFKIS